MKVSPLLGLNEESAGMIIQDRNGKAASFSEPNQFPVKAPQRMVAELRIIISDRAAGVFLCRRCKRMLEKREAEKKIRP